MQLRHDRRGTGVITRPDLCSAEENAYRARLLYVARGYGARTGLLSGLPRGVRWKRAYMNLAELSKVKYINYSYWIELSGGSRLPGDGADGVRSGRTSSGESARGFWNIARKLDRGERLPEMIIVANGRRGPFIVLEGHTRLTALMLARRPPKRIEVIIGFSGRITGWDSIFGRKTTSPSFKERMKRAMGGRR